MDVFAVNSGTSVCHKGGKVFQRLAVIAALALLMDWAAGAALARDSFRQELNAGRVTIIIGGFEYGSRTDMRPAGEMAAVTDETGELRLFPIMGQGPKA